MKNIFYVKNYISEGISDSEAIRNCFADANKIKEPRTVIFDGKDYFLDEAIVLSSDTHVIIDGCTLKQKDEVFDNIFRGENIIVNPDEPYGYPLDVLEIKNVTIEGRGNAKLIGTDVPRIGYHPGKNEYQKMVGDFWGWRTMMISFALGENIEICGLELSKTMCWAVTFEWCSDVYVHDLAIYADVKNGDGIDFRSGCHHCKVENISGYTSDDTVACTALSRNKRGTYPNAKGVYPMSVAAGCAGERTFDIHDIEIKGITTGGLHHGVICLAANGDKVYNISISDINEAPIGARYATVSIYTGYGKGYTAGDIHNIKVNGIRASHAKYALELRADVRDIEVYNVVHENPGKKQMVMFPHRDLFVVGCSSCSLPASQINEKLFREYRDAEMLYMELSHATGDEEFLDFSAIKELSYKNGITISSYHLPFKPFDKIDISSPKLAEYSVEHFKKLIEKASSVGINKFVIHPSNDSVDEAERASRIERAKASLASLADFAAKRGAVIAVENLPKSFLGRDSKEILELISAHPMLKVCFDTNHLFGESHSDFIKAVGNKILTTHISDYDFESEKHLTPGEGKIDWSAIVSNLQDVEYNGMWIYEIWPKNETISTAELKNLCLNAEKIFKGEPLGEL